MKRKIKIILIKKLKLHEKVDKRKVHNLVEDLKKRKRLTNPILVSKESYIVLDGHHRIKAFEKLGLLKIPVEVVDYLSSDVKIFFRRRKILTQILKRMIIKRAHKGILFPVKTTRHLANGRIRNINIAINKLR